MLAVTTLAFAVATFVFCWTATRASWGISFDYLPDNLLQRVQRIPQCTLFGDVDIASERQFYFVCIVVLFVVLLAVRGL